MKNVQSVFMEQRLDILLEANLFLDHLKQLQDLSSLLFYSHFGGCNWLTYNVNP